MVSQDFGLRPLFGGFQGPFEFEGASPLRNSTPERPRGQNWPSIY